VTNTETAPRHALLPGIHPEVVHPAVLRGAGTTARRAWRRRYVRRIALGDAVCALVAAAVGYLVRFAAVDGHPSPASLVIAVCLPLVWLFAMSLARCYEERFLWEGPEEFRRVFFAAALLVAAVGAASWAAELEVARGFVVVTLPLAALLTLGQRWIWRKWLHRRRAAGDLVQTTLLVGRPDGVAALERQITGRAGNGYQVIGCCLPVECGPQRSGPVRVLGTLDDVVDVVRRFEVDTVAVLPSTELEGAQLRRLGWELEGTQAELLLAPAVTEIAGPRVHIRPVWGLPLLHMERPELHGVRRLTKEVVDRAGAALGLLLVLPVLLGIALAIKTTSRGPVLFRQVRVGRGGTTFRMLKFRTMVTDADRLVDALRGSDDGNGVLFKLRSDPRVTRIGRVLRRYSLDELPQLLNVVRGEMSLVGPRPPLPSEVARYGWEMHRRFLVKPGLTGLWQISGRSDLSWEDSVRMDLRYVENWSLTYDLMILVKTLRAVVHGRGAY
jgi:exopolysaccharide biosynthesis polyprenyl glycosylphosphotransferase